MPRGRYSLEAIFSAKDKFARPIARMQTRFTRFARAAARGMQAVNRASKRLSGGLDKIKTGLKAAGIAAAAAVAVAGKHIVETGATFEQTLINAAAKFPGAVKQGTVAFAKLEKAASHLGETTEFSASQAAEGLNFLAMAGFDAGQSVAALPGLVDLATAAQIELGEASDVATDSLGAFNLVTKDAVQLGKNLARVNDVIAKTTTTANTNVQDMFEAIKAGAPIATNAGASLETYSSMVGTLANAGIKGSAAGNTLKNVFARLSAPPSEAAKALKKLGIETLDANKNLRDAPDIIGDLSKALEGMGTGQKTGFLTDIFGLRAVAGASVLLQSGSESLKTYRKQLEGAAGASKDMAATMRDSTQGDIKSFGSAFEAIEIAIFGALKAPLRDFVKSVTELMRQNKPAVAEFFKNLVPVIVRLAKAFGGSFMRTIRAVGDALGVFGTSDPRSGEQWIKMFESMAITIGQVVAVGLSMVGAFIAISAGVGAILNGLWRSVTHALDRMAEVIAGMLAPWIDMFQDLMAIFDAEGLSLGDKALKMGGAIVRGLVNGIKKMASGPVDAIKALGKGVIDGFADALGMRSPSRKMADKGKLAVAGLPIGMKSGLRDVERAASLVAKAAIPNVAPWEAMVRANVGPDRRPIGRADRQVIGPDERAAARIQRSFHEERKTERHELLVRDETGRVERRSPKGSSMKIEVARSSGAPRGG